MQKREVVQRLKISQRNSKLNNYGKPHSACATIKTKGCDWKIPIIGWQIGWQITRF